VNRNSKVYLTETYHYF